MPAQILRSEFSPLATSLLFLTVVVGPLSADPWPPAETLSRDLVTAPSPDRTRLPGRSRLVVEQGTVFLNGQYLEPPYVLETNATEVLINGQVLQSPLNLQLIPDDETTTGHQSPAISPRQFVRQLRDTLSGEGFLIAFAGEPTCLIPDRSEACDLLHKALLPPGPGDSTDVTDCDSLFAYLPEQIDQPAWTAWLASSPAPPALQERIAALRQLRDEMEASNMQAIQATHTLDAVAYPLTTFGMMACVFAIGHLLLYRPDPAAKPYEINAAPHLLKMVRTSLILIVVFSTLDLVWTLLAHQAGQMKELNPLGNGLIDSPLSLAIFKGAATLVAVGVLFAIRKYPRGQLAAWWVCLTVTLITIRWVAFNSMFVS